MRKGNLGNEEGSGRVYEIHTHNDDSGRGESESPICHVGVHQRK